MMKQVLRAATTNSVWVEEEQGKTLALATRPCGVMTAVPPEPVLALKKHHDGDQVGVCAVGVTVGAPVGLLAHELQYLEAWCCAHEG